MRVLTRYLIGQILTPLALAIGLFSLVLVADRLLDWRQLIFLAGAGSGLLIKLFLCALPWVLTLTIPMAYVLACLLAYGRLAEDNEILAMSAGGVDARTIMRPGLLLGACLTVCLYPWTLWVAPRSLRVQIGTVVEIFKQSPLVGLTEATFNDMGNGLLFYPRRIIGPDRRIEGLWMFSEAEEGETLGESYTGVLYAASAAVDYDPETDHLRFLLGRGSSDRPGKDGRFTHVEFGWSEQAIDPSRTVFRNLRAEGLQRRGKSQRVLRDEARHLGGELAAMRAAAGGTPRPGAPAPDGRSEEDWQEQVNKYMNLEGKWLETRLTLHERLAMPLSCVLLGLVGVPLGLVTRQGKKSMALLLCLLMAGGYYLLVSLGDAAVRDGWMPPFAGAWFPNAVLGALGALLCRQVVRR